MRSGTKTEPGKGIITKTRNGTGTRRETDIETAIERGRKNGIDIGTETRIGNPVHQNTRKRRRSCRQLTRITRRITSCTVFVKHPTMSQSKYWSKPLTIKHKLFSKRFSCGFFCNCMEKIENGKLGEMKDFWLHLRLNWNVSCVFLRFYIGCDLCSNWFHGACVGITEKEAQKLEAFVCNDCKRGQEGSSAEELYCICRTPYDESQYVYWINICCLHFLFKMWIIFVLDENVF